MIKRKVERLGLVELLKGKLPRVFGALLATGAIIFVHIYGYLSILPSGIKAAIGSEFIFNYSLQFGLSVAMASFLGWQIGDTVGFLTHHLKLWLKKFNLSSQFFTIALQVFSFDFLGDAKFFILRLSFGVIAFCYIFSGFEVLFFVLFLIEVFLIWAISSMYLRYKNESEDPLSFGAWLNELTDELLESDWREFEALSMLPILIFLSLLISFKLGESRASRVLQGEPAFILSQDQPVTVFATSTVGLILAASGNETSKREKPLFLLLSSSGEILLRSK